VKQTILAKRYAKAIFSIGREQNSYEGYNEVLQGLAELFHTHPEVADALTNPLYPMEIKEKVMTGMVASMEGRPGHGQFPQAPCPEKTCGVAAGDSRGI
jgi:F-type H+-transporting ATPase subunit delta